MTGGSGLDSGTDVSAGMVGGSDISVRTWGTGGRGSRACFSAAISVVAWLAGITATGAGAGFCAGMSVGLEACCGVGGGSIGAVGTGAGTAFIRGMGGMVSDGIVDRAGAIVGSGVGAASPRTVCSEGVALFVDGAATTGSAGSDGEAGRDAGAVFSAGIPGASDVAECSGGDGGCGGRRCIDVSRIGCDAVPWVTGGEAEVDETGVVITIGAMG